LFFAVPQYLLATFVQNFARMFFFGLFSTHLPYILVGVIYFASFAFASLQAMKSGVLEEQHEEKSNETQIQPQNPGLADVFFFDGTSDSLPEAIEQETPQASLTEKDIKFIVHSDPYISSFSSGGLFVRPPPVLV
jgi:hypothetical protein